MTKAELATIISDKTGVSKIDVLITLEQFFKEVQRNLAQGENIYVRGFGSFIVKKRAAKKARNMANGQPMIIPEKYVPSFKPSIDFMKRVDKSMKEKEAKASSKKSTRSKNKTAR